MSTAESEQDKQPISAVKGQEGGVNDAVPSGKDESGDLTPPTEVTKSTSETEIKANDSNVTEAESAKKGDEVKKENDAQNSDIVVNGDSSEGHENGSPLNRESNETTQMEEEKPADTSELDESNVVTIPIDSPREQDKAETVPVKVEEAVPKNKEGEEAGDKSSVEQNENQPLEGSAVAVTDLQAADRQRAVTIDNPSDMKELAEKSGESAKEDTNKLSAQERSRTLGDIEGSASTPLKEDVAARSQTVWLANEANGSTAECEPAEETISYSTSIVGGVVHRTPIQSNSPKTLHKQKEGSPQLSSPKKRSVIDSLFRRRKKSKGDSEIPPETIPNERDSASNPSGAGTDTAKDSNKLLEKNEGTGGAQNMDTDQGAAGDIKSAAAEEGEDSDAKPQLSEPAEEATVEEKEQSNDCVKDEEAETNKESEVEEGRVESQDEHEGSTPVEGAKDNDETSPEALKDEEPEEPEEIKDTVKRAHTDNPEEEETSPPPAAKKKKTIFGGIFTKRKSKKSKGEDTSSPDKAKGEKDDIPDEEPQPVDDTTPAAEVEGVEMSDDGKDQSTLTETDDSTATAQQEVTVDVITPAVDQALVSAQEEAVTAGKVDENTEGKEEDVTKAGEPSTKVDDTLEGNKKSSEESLHSEGAETKVKKEETEEKHVTTQETQPKKKNSFFGGILARRKSKKTKGVDEDPAVETSQQEEDDKVEEEQGESSSTDDAKPDSAEVKETPENGQGEGATPDSSDATPAGEKEEVEPVMRSAVDEPVESANEEGAEADKDDSNVDEQETKRVEAQTKTSGDDEKSSEDAVQPKEAEAVDGRKEPEEKAVTIQDNQPQKKKSIFGGFFARRKSKKLKDDSSSPSDDKLHENDGDKVEEHKDDVLSNIPADDTTPDAEEAGKTVESGGETGTEQNGADDTIPHVEVAGEKVESETEQNAVLVAGDATLAAQNEVAEDVISPAADQAVERAPEETPVKEKVDEEIGGQESEVAEEGELSNQEVEPVVAVEVQKSAENESGIENDKATVKGSPEPTAAELTSPEAEEAQDKVDTALKERQALMKGSHSPKTRRMQMRISYAETDGEGGREVEVIGTPERDAESPTQKGKTPPDQRVSCRALGDADHEGWLTKKGGPFFFASWKRKWVVLKDGKLYYFKTSFDPEASGIINMQGITVAPAPETKKSFCFKCEHSGPKPQVFLFMAESKEEMERWLSVLAAASKGETIQKTKQQHLAVKDEVVMRKKSGSISSAQRTSSVLAYGGRHSLIEDEDDSKSMRKRSTPGSFSKVPQVPETEDKEETNSVPFETEPLQTGTEPVTEPTEEKQKETSESGEGQSTEKPEASVDEVVVNGGQVVLESSPPVEVSPEKDAPPVESSGDAASTEASPEGDKRDEGASPGVEKRDKGAVDAEEKKEPENARPEQESAGSAVDTTDGDGSVVTTESSVTVVETVETTSVFSEKVDTAVSVVKMEVTEVTHSEHQTETVEVKQDIKEDVFETSPTDPDASEPVSPSKTKWYFTLDRQESWSVATETEEKKPPVQKKSSSSFSDKGSIRSDRSSIKSDQGSVKSSSEDDQLLVLCRNIKKARLSIVGDRMWEGPDRLRAWSTVKDNSEEQAFVKLKTLERTLKDKEKHLSELEELLTQPEINRDSIYAWKLRYSDLVEEMFPIDNGEDGQKKVKDNEEGAEGEPEEPKKPEAEKEDEEVKSKDVEGTEKEVKEGDHDEGGKKSEGEAVTCSYNNQENLDGKKESCEGEENTDGTLNVANEEQQSGNGREEADAKEDDSAISNNNQNEVKGAPLLDLKQKLHETGTEREKHDQEEEISSEEKPSDGQEESVKLKSNGAIEDTHF